MLRENKPPRMGRERGKLLMEVGDHGGSVRWQGVGEWKVTYLFLKSSYHSSRRYCHHAPAGPAPGSAAVPMNSWSRPVLLKAQSKGTKTSSSGWTALTTDVVSQETRSHAKATVEVILHI